MAPNHGLKHPKCVLTNCPKTQSYSKIWLWKRLYKRIIFSEFQIFFLQKIVKNTKKNSTLPKKLKITSPLPICLWYMSLIYVFLRKFKIWKIKKKKLFSEFLLILEKSVGFGWRWRWRWLWPSRWLLKSPGKMWAPPYIYRLPKKIVAKKPMLSFSR